jgi:hypothetical protein
VVLRSPSIEKAKEVLKENTPKKEEVVFDYEPEMDKSKKSLTKDDRKYLQNYIKKNHREGLKGLFKKMKGKYSDKLIEEIRDASEKYGDLEGVYEYLEDYEKKQEDFKEWQKGPAIKQKKRNPEL